MRRTAALLVVALVAFASCDDSTSDVELSIYLPDDGDAFDAEPITIRFLVPGNGPGDLGVRIDVTSPVVEAAWVWAAPGVTVRNITFMPDADTGPYRAVIRGIDEYDGEDHETIAWVDLEWTAPWQPTIMICNRRCAPLVNGQLVAGSLEIGVSLPWDASRLERIDVLFDGVPVSGSATSVQLSLEGVLDGPHLITLTARRDDGFEATVEGSVTVASSAADAH